jgi:DNA repair exonuclease SbcCD nuclease subunit
LRILACGDVHWSQYSSILRGRGEKYSIRLEKLIDAVNWVEELAISHKCDATVYLGDFFDQSQLNSEELTALQDVNWNDNAKLFLVGNHEMGLSTLDYSSAHIFQLGNRSTVCSSPSSYMIGDTEICLLPYILNSDKNSITDYLVLNPIAKKRIIFSHNDIAGIQLGKFMTKSGFTIEDIESNCDLFINGHLHNGGAVSDKIYNIGNLTGQNFSEDAFKYEHCVFIIDTDTLQISIYENPYAINFYKLDFTEKSDIDTLNKVSASLKSNSVITVRCKLNNSAYIKERFEPIWKTPDNEESLVPRNPNILESRVIIDVEPMAVDSTLNVTTTTVNSVNHLQQFEEFIYSTLGTSDIVKFELEELLR